MSKKDEIKQQSLGLLLLGAATVIVGIFVAAATTGVTLAGALVLSGLIVAAYSLVSLAVRIG